MSGAGKPNGNGQMQPSDANNKFNAMSFLINQILANVRTMVLVRVDAVTSNGELAEAGTVDATPIVNQLDGDGNATPHGTVYGLIYFRLQGGKNAVIIDPVVGDIGWAAIADRDISAAKVAKGVANPGSYRRFCLSDGVYIGGVLNGVPEQYVQFNADGVTIADKNGNKIAMKAGAIEVTTAEFRVNGKVFAGYGTGDQVGLQTHTHPSAPTGPPAAPTAGT